MTDDRNAALRKAAEALVVVVERFVAAMEGVELRFDLHPQLALLRPTATATRAALAQPDVDLMAAEERGRQHAFAQAARVAEAWGDAQTAAQIRALAGKEGTK